MWELILYSTISALIIVLVLDVPFLKKGINLADEGYLYFGTRQVLKGKVPVVDFRSYDPGRYYWCALWLGIFGESLWTQRISMSFLKWITLAIVGFLCFQISNSWLIVILIQLGCLGWLLYNYKMIECLFTSAQLLSFWMLAQYGNDFSFASMAFLLSFSLFLGLNMTVYQVGAVMLLFVFNHQLIFNIPWNAMLLGLIAGSIPLLIILVRYPTFLKHYWIRKINPILKRKSTNLKLPYPWLWRNPTHIIQSSPSRTFAAKLLFTVIPIFIVSIAVLLLFKAIDCTENTPLILPAIVVGIPWLNHIISRADIGHLHLIGLPVGILLINLSTIYIPFMGTVVLALAWMIFSIWFFQPSFAEFGAKSKLKKLRIEGRAFWMTRNQKVVITQVLKLVEERRDKTTFFAPSLCMLYALSDTKPGAYDTFPVYPASTSKQQEMIDELSASSPTLLVINNFHLDKNPERCFSASHPLVWEYLKNQFKTLAVEKLPSTYFVFTKIAN